MNPNRRPTRSLLPKPAAPYSTPATRTSPPSYALSSLTPSPQKSTHDSTLKLDPELQLMSPRHSTLKLDPELQLMSELQQSITPTPHPPLQTHTTLLIGRLETPLHIPEPHIHTSPILAHMCCGPLSDPSEPHTIRLPADSPALFSQITHYLSTNTLIIKISSETHYNALQISRTTNAVHFGPSADATTRRSQLALRNITELYALCLKYRFMEVLVGVVKKLVQYLDPMVVPEAFLWQMALMFEGVEGEVDVVVECVRRALARLGGEKAVDVVERVTERVCGNEKFARYMWAVLVEVGYLIRSDGVLGV